MSVLHTVLMLQACLTVPLPCKPAAQHESFDNHLSDSPSCVYVNSLFVSRPALAAASNM